MSIELEETTSISSFFHDDTGACLLLLSCYVVHCVNTNLLATNPEMMLRYKRLPFSASTSHSKVIKSDGLPSAIGSEQGKKASGL